MATEHEKAEGPEASATADLVEIKHEDVPVYRQAVQAIKAFEHPITRNGVRQDTAIKLGALGRFLREIAEAYQEQYNDEVDRYGERTNPEDAKTAKVAKDSPHRSAFNAAIYDLNRVTVEVPENLRIKLSELKVRDENGELVEMECGRIGDLGVLLVEAKIEEPAQKKAPRRRVRAV